jgi:hypothetical protein
VRDGEGVGCRSKASQNTHDFVVIADGRDNHGADSQRPDGGRIHPCVSFSIITAELLARLDAEAGKAAFHAQNCADFWSGGAAARAANDFVGIAFAQSDGGAGCIGEGLGALRNYA